MSHSAIGTVGKSESISFMEFVDNKKIEWSVALFFTEGIQLKCVFFNCHCLF